MHMKQEIDNFIKCQNCGAINVENARFCAECGKILPINESQLVKSSKCPVCGNKNQKDSKFCSECGNDLPLKNDSSSVVCTACGTMNVPGSVFCSECGKKIFEKEPKNNKQQKNEIKIDYNTIISEISMVLNAIADILANIFDRINSLVNQHSSKKSRYLICKKCGGYYKLKSGEFPQDYNKCECGGQFYFSDELN
jgi:predicted nucleic acid-binding Zn ribbon protein